jgi:uncharacterized protein YxjI
MDAAVVTRACPACGKRVSGQDKACPFCHVIFSKYRSRPADDEGTEQFNQDLKRAGALMVQQRSSLTEALIGFERKNVYDVTDDGGRTLYTVEEESPWWVRQFLRGFRPLSLSVTQTVTSLVLFRISKPFRLWHPRVEIADRAGRPLGSVESGFPIPVRWYTVRDERGVTVFRISGAFWRPWTFKVFRGAEQAGEIKKKWSGLLREALTDADTFGATFPQDTAINQKALLLAALFLIDIVHFENNNNS